MENCLEDADDDMEQNPYHCLLKFSSITEIYNNFFELCNYKKTCDCSIRNHWQINIKWQTIISESLLLFDLYDYCLL